MAEPEADFAAFLGAIVITSNCLIEPSASYRQLIFTVGTGVRHITDDFTPAIQAALALAGFQEDEPEKTVRVGFGYHAMLGVADKVIDAVKSGAIKHFFLMMVQHQVVPITLTLLKWLLMIRW